MVGAVKNSKDREKRRHKKIARQKANRDLRVIAFKAEAAQKQAKRKKLQQALELTKDGERIPSLGDEDYLFWLCHGANYIASDGTTGVWTPLFDDIYQGVLPPAEEVAQRVLRAYAAELEAEGQFRGVPRAVLAWTVTDRSIVTIYKHEAVKRLKAKDPDCDAEVLARSPHNPVVWTLMDRVKARSLAAGAEMDENAVTEIEEPQEEVA